jgi:hypothetical protein
LADFGRSDLSRFPGKKHLNLLEIRGKVLVREVWRIVVLHELEHSLLETGEEADVINLKRSIQGLQKKTRQLFLSPQCSKLILYLYLSNAYTNFLAELHISVCRGDWS